jgi:predicted phage terminase large subunit-like protein
MLDFPPELLEKVKTSPAMRRELASRDILWFFVLYFPHYIQYEIAPFHKEMLSLLQDESVRFLATVAFRGSAKSTYCQLVYPLWSILCKRNKHFAVLVNQTQSRGQQALLNIRQECELNNLLIEDFGPFVTASSEWSNSTLVFPEYRARITAVSVSESVRGVRHGEFRPDLIVADDIEDVASSRTQEGRDKAWEFLNSELIPAGDRNTKIVMIGNLVHSDSVMMRVKERITDQRLDGVFRHYPLERNSLALWTGKYPDKASIDLLKKQVSHVDFQREYMLKIISRDEQIVLPEWIQYWQEMPTKISEVLIAIDPAFSEKDTACKSAIIVGTIVGSGKQSKLYIHSFPFNQRCRQPKLIAEIEKIYAQVSKLCTCKILVEQAGQQLGLIDSLKAQGLPVIGVPIKGDKYARLSTSSLYIKDGSVLFPKQGNEELVNQLIFFGSEQYKDLADAFSLVTGYLIEKLSKPMPQIFSI